jgi:hypothetical protein
LSYELISYDSSKKYLIILIVWIPSIFLVSDFASKYLDDNYIIPGGMIIGFFLLAIFGKVIIKKFFSKTVNFDFSEKDCIAINMNNSTNVFNFSEIAYYNIQHTKSNYELTLINYSNKKMHFVFISDQNCIDFLDEIQHKINTWNSIQNSPYFIDLKHPYKVSSVLQVIYYFILSIGILVSLYALYNKFYLYFILVLSSVFGFYIRYKKSYISNMLFYEHVKSGNSISSFKI